MGKRAAVQGRSFALVNAYVSEQVNAIQCVPRKKLVKRKLRKQSPHRKPPLYRAISSANSFLVIGGSVDVVLFQDVSKLV